jgi:hypothetical protein
VWTDLPRTACGEPSFRFTLLLFPSTNHFSTPPVKLVAMKVEAVRFMELEKRRTPHGIVTCEPKTQAKWWKVRLASSSEMQNTMLSGCASFQKDRPVLCTSSDRVAALLCESN